MANIYSGLSKLPDDRIVKVYIAWYGGDELYYVLEWRDTETELQREELEMRVPLGNGEDVSLIAYCFYDIVPTEHQKMILAHATLA